MDPPEGNRGWSADQLVETLTRARVAGLLLEREPIPGHRLAALSPRSTMSFLNCRDRSSRKRCNRARTLPPACAGPCAGRDEQLPGPILGRRFAWTDALFTLTSAAPGLLR
jgi:hypothetical protein